MEFSSSPSLDLVALVDPAARGAAPQLVPDRSGDAAAGAGLAFDLCLGQLLPALPSGEALPPAGKDLPVVAVEDAATDGELTTETLALGLPGWLATPVPGALPPPVSTALDGSAASGLAPPAGGALTTAIAAATQTPEKPLAQGASTGGAAAVTTAAQSAVVAAASAEPSPAATSGTEAVLDGALASPQVSASEDGAAQIPAPVDAASVADDYATATANAALRGDATNAPRRGDDVLRGIRPSWRDARHVNGGVAPSTSAPAADDATASTAPSAAAAVAPAAPPVRGDFMTHSRGQNAEGAVSAAEVAAPPSGHGASWFAPGTLAPQASSSGAASAAGANAQHTPVDTTQPRWQEAFASRVQWLADQNVGEAHLRLNPPDLGTVDVKISLVEDRTFVHLTTHTAAARDELAQSLPRLRELFVASGLELGGASVQNGRDGQAHYDGSPPERGYSGREPAVPGVDEGAGGRTAARRAATAVGRIDLFA